MLLLITILVLLIIMIGLFLIRIYQFKQPRTIRWQVGHQVFTFRFPFNWLHRFRSSQFLTNFLMIIGSVIIGIIALIAIVVFLFLFMGIVLPIILIIGLVMIILFLIFVL